MARDIDEGRTVIRVDHHEGWSAGERLQVARVETIGFFGVRFHFAVEYGIEKFVVSFSGEENATKVITEVFRRGLGGETAVTGDVQHESTIGRQLFLPRGQEDGELRDGRLVQQILVRVVSFQGASAIFLR